MLQATLQRAEHAISASLTHHVDAAKKLQVERSNLQSALNQLSNITGEAVSNWQAPTIY